MELFRVLEGGTIWYIGQIGQEVLHLRDIHKIGGDEEGVWQRDLFKDSENAGTFGTVMIGLSSDFTFARYSSLQKFE